MNRVTAYVGLGSNLGDRGGLIEAGLSALAAHGRVEVTARSALVETPPVGPPQPTYLNGAAAVRTDLDPADLLAALAPGHQPRWRRLRFVLWVGFPLQRLVHEELPGSP